MMKLGLEVVEMTKLELVLVEMIELEASFEVASVCEVVVVADEAGSSVLVLMVQPAVLVMMIESVLEMMTEPAPFWTIQLAVVLVAAAFVVVAFLFASPFASSFASLARVVEDPHEGAIESLMIVPAAFLVE